MEQKDLIKNLKVIYAGIMGMITLGLLALIAFNVIYGGTGLTQSSLTKKIYLIVYTTIGIFSIIAALFVINKQIKELNGDIAKYRSIIIIRGALFEGVAIFFLVGYYLTNSYIYVIETIITLVIMAFFFPTNKRIEKEAKIKIE